MDKTNVTAHINSLNGKMDQVTLLGPNFLFGHKIDNSYIFKFNKKLCTGIMNYFTCQYYVDDINGVIGKNNENYRLYKKYL